jgi:hypothetical protein
MVVISLLGGKKLEAEESSHTYRVNASVLWSIFTRSLDQILDSWFLMQTTKMPTLSDADVPISVTCLVTMLSLNKGNLEKYVTRVTLQEITVC